MIITPNIKAFVILLITFVLIFYLFAIIQSCKKLEFEKVARVKTGEATDVTSNSASVTGIIQDVGESGVTQYGHCWSTNQNPKIDLDATNSYGTSYGNQVSFTTGQSASLPALTTITISSITDSSAQS